MIKESKTKPRQISKDQYLIVVALLKLAKENNNILSRTEKAIAAILQEPKELGGYGHISDDIWCGLENADDLLERMDIKVK